MADAAATRGDNANNDLASQPSKPTSKAAAQAAQMNKLRDANTKYKNLLKMAKERIQQQEYELEQLRRTSY